MPFVNLCLCLRVLSNFDTYTTQKSNRRTVVFAVLLFTCLRQGGVSSIAQRAEGNWHVHKHEYIHIYIYAYIYTYVRMCVWQIEICLCTCKCVLCMCVRVCMCDYKIARYCTLYVNIPVNCMHI